jgi:hypothetical protein
MLVNSSRSSSNTFSSYTASETPTGETAQHTNTEETIIGIETESPDGEADGMAMVLGGEATAVGEDTVAIGSIEGQVADTGSGLIGEGSASFSASGEASGDGLAYAYADSYGAASDADTIVTVSTKSAETLQTGSQSTWTEASTTELLAVEIETPSTSSDLGTTGEAQPQGSISPSDTTGESSLESDDLVDGLDGNLAIIVVEAEAVADDSFVLIDAFALSVDDQLSVVSGTAWLGVG